jgi:mxaJ protein
MSRTRAFAVAGVALTISSGSLAGPEPAPRAPAPSIEPLRVCADPNNLPFTNEAREGFENELAELIATELGRTVEYTWWPQRRGFVRNTLKAKLCDVVLGVPAGYELTATTRPYYRSTYVLVSRADRKLAITSLEDERLAKLRIGVHVVGDDYANVPPAEALVRRGLGDRLVGFSIYGDYSRPNPPAELIHAVARGDIDAALAWGPLAGYFASKARPRLRVTPLESPPDVDMTFAIAMGVRRGDDQLREQLDQFIVRKQAAIDRLLARYGVPRLPLPRAAQTVPPARSPRGRAAGR